MIGIPGSGKSTLMRALTEGYTRWQVWDVCPHVLLTDPSKHPQTLIELGVDRRPFGGTDGLPLGIQPRAVAWLESTAHDRVVAEGDRLANEKFFSSAKAAGWEVHVAHLDVSTNDAKARRAARGSRQNPTWIKGRETKVRRLAETAQIRLDGHRPTPELATVLREIIAG